MMIKMLQKTVSLIQAEIVLNHINILLNRSQLSDKIKKRINPYVECYQNGREQGYSISAYDLKNRKSISISFSENRNSDVIVVYIGEPSSSGISENAYKNRRTFETEYDAADYIFKELKKLSIIDGDL